MCGIRSDGIGEEEFIKGYELIFEDDWYGYYIDCSVGFIGVYIY